MIARLQHAAILSSTNQRRLARFYHYVFEMQEVWNREGKSPYPHYLGDGNFQLNCNLIREGSKRVEEIFGRKIFPKPGINHIGFQVKNIQEISERLKSAAPDKVLLEAHKDGRYEAYRLIDPDGNDIELSEAGWDPGRPQNSYPAIQHIGIKTQNPYRLAKFYEEIFELKWIYSCGRNTVSLSDGFVSLTLTSVSLIEKTGFQVLGFKVPRIEGIKKRLVQTWPQYSFTGEDQPQLIQDAYAVYPFKPCSLWDPEGNCINLCEEGWMV